MPKTTVRRTTSQLRLTSGLVMSCYASTNHLLLSKQQPRSREPLIQQRRLVDQNHRRHHRADVAGVLLLAGQDAGADFDREAAPAASASTFFSPAL